MLYFMGLSLKLQGRSMHQGPKNPEQNSPKLCLETIYNKNFEAAPAKCTEKAESLIVKVHCRNQDQGLHSHKMQL